MNRGFTSGGIDIWMLVAVVVCLLFGVAALSGFALVSSPPDWSLLIRQTIALVLGGCMAVALTRVDIRVLAGWSGWAWALSVLALIAVLFVGQVHRGTVGWFDLGFATVQPVEGMKVVLILTLASLLGRRTQARFDRKTILMLCVSIGAPILLVLQQPDYGSAGVLLAVSIILMILGGLRWRVVFGAGMVALALGAWMWTSVLADFQQERILTFLDANRDPLGRGYNVAQAKIAIGSGQLMGKGLGFGSQSQLHFLPEAQTDFLFAAIGEEFGFFGVVVLLSAYGIFLWRVWRLVRLASDPVSAFTAAGITAIFWVQGTITIGMNMGVIPVTGLPLPFVSYGGSSLLASCILFGIAQGIAMRSRTVQRLEVAQDYLPLYVR